jgi:serine O-acetyltransferase
MFGFRHDLKKYKKYSGKNALVLFLTQQGLWALFVYRFYNKIYRSNLPKVIKRFFLFFGVIDQKCIEICTGISIPYSAKIGHSFYIGHFGNVIINANCVIGDNCNISQGVTLGVSGKGERRGVPILGNSVYVGANATIAGAIIVGDLAVIGANSLVVNNVSPGTTVLGVPAKQISTNNSKEYI